MISSTLAKQLEDKRKVIDDAIEAAVDSYPWAVPVLKEAAGYSLAGGKRLRSIILLSVLDELSSASDASQPVNQSGRPGSSSLSRSPEYLDGPMAFAVALEMIQAYSLVHDDLPCMDDDDYRRGRLSCHKQFGEAIALLCGDALLTMAFECMLSCKSIPQERVLRAAFEIARAAGPSGMVRGQVLDLLLEGQTDVSGIPDMYRMKTGALFRCSAMAGAILAGASTNVVELCGTWGELFGYAYQIIDDIEDSGAGGKEQDKNTLLKTMSVSEACTEAKQCLTKSIEAASAVFPGQALIKELSGMYLSRLEALERSEDLEHSNSNDGRR
jgi:geranylgeranyl diphosphate synthase type II